MFLATMPSIRAIKLYNFRNYRKLNANFIPEVNAFLGFNGSGKTNLQDAIHYLCLGKSYFSSGDRHIVHHGEEGFRVEGVFERLQRNHKVALKVRVGQSKELSLDAKKYEKLSDHLGFLPIVIIAPADIMLLLEGGEARRKLMDYSLTQIDRDYLHHLMSYNRLLKQRNALLKQFNDRQYFDKVLLDAITQKMIEPAHHIHKKRKAFCEKLSTKFEEKYKIISGDRELCKCQYRSDLDDASLDDLMNESLEKDSLMGRTRKGIHKDDIKFYIHDELLKPYASQGQLKSFILSIKLAQYDILRDHLGEDKPIVVLDDIFDKLDMNRVKALLELLSQDHFGQVFLSDTSTTRIPGLMKELKTEIAVFHVDNATLVRNEEA